jgi:hypothetical protein
MSGARYELLVALPSPLGSKKIIVTAAQAVGILSADRGARVIDTTATCFGIKKLTDCFEDVVLLMAKDAAGGRILGVSLFRLVVRDAEVTRDPQDVPLRNLDSFVAAAIRRTLRAVEQHSQRTRVFLRVPIAYDIHSESLIEE